VRPIYFTALGLILVAASCLMPALGYLDMAYTVGALGFTMTAYSIGYVFGRVDGKAEK
jgi:hypothetical protein